MMSISTVSAGAAASGYYKTEGYYMEGSKEWENSATWFGKAAEAEGLTGQVDDAKFTEILEGHTSDGTKVMGRWVNGERQHRPGLDLTFSASKSASVVALVYGDERVIDAHDKAVRSTLEFVQDRFLQTRYQVDGEMVTQTGVKAIAGVFRHDTSRALDAQLHTHAVFANMVLNEAGQFTALQNDAIYKASKLITEFYRAEFDTNVKEIGYETERGRHGGIDIVGVNQDVIEHHSKRRQQILQSLKDRGLEPTPKNAEMAALATRVKKQTGVDREELRAGWRKEAAELGLTENQMSDFIAHAEQRQAENTGARPGRSELKKDAVMAVRQGIDHLSERASVYERNDLIVAASKFSHHPNIQRIETEIGRLEQNHELFASGKDKEILTDDKTVAVEREVLANWRGSRRSGGVALGIYQRLTGMATLKRQMQGSTLTDGQKEAILTGLSTSKDRYVAIQGYAGTGKTYAMEKLQHYAERSGYKVEGYAPSWQAVKALKGALDNSGTLANLLKREETHPEQVDKSKIIMVVDEASMISAKDMKALMDHAERTNVARMILLGDHQQLDSVNAGGPFAQLQKAGIRLAVMDDIQRQRNENLKDAVNYAIRGEVKAAFATIGANIVSKSDYVGAAANAWIDLDSETRAKTRIITLTNKARDTVNDTVRAALKDEGVLSGREIKLDVLDPLELTQAQAADVRSYKSKDVILATTNNAVLGVKRNELFDVVGIDEQQGQLRLREVTQRREITVEAKPGNTDLSALQAYTKAERDLSAGDAVRFKITDKEAHITNGQTGTVTAVTEDVVTVKREDGETFKLPFDGLAARGIQHDYAATTHAVQGASIPNIIAMMGANEQLTNQKAFYVQISRAIDEAALYTDNPERLASRIQDNTGIRPDALNAWLEHHREEREEAKATSRSSTGNTSQREENEAPQATEAKDLQDAQAERDASKNSEKDKNLDSSQLDQEIAKTDIKKIDRELDEEVNRLVEHVKTREKEITR